MPGLRVASRWPLDVLRRASPGARSWHRFDSAGSTVTGVDPGPVLGVLQDPAGLLPLHHADLRMLARSLQLFASSLARRDGAVPANLRVLQSAVERALASAATTARLPSSEVLGMLGTTNEALPANMDSMEIDEVSAVLRCSSRNVRYLARRGSLSGVKVGGRWTFERLDVLALLDTRRSA